MDNLKALKKQLKEDIITLIVLIILMKMESLLNM